MYVTRFHQGHSAPSVDRRNKPGTAPPRVNRDCKPGKGREYVNIPMRSATVKDSSYQPPRKGGNVQRSKSSVAEYESEGYLYMDSPQRTESSLRYRRSDKEASLPEEDAEYEYMCLKNDTVYQNCDAPSTPPTTKKEPERTPAVSLLERFVPKLCSFVICGLILSTTNTVFQYYYEYSPPSYLFFLYEFRVLIY